MGNGQVTCKLSEPFEDKVTVLLKSVGNAPVLARSKFALDRENRFGFIIAFLRKQLSVAEDQALVNLEV